ncbi:sulfurtransferase complex subunit TusB [Pseudomonas sp. KNUC1026]|uniref:sulfurtransferase complex subunit TusB n=1 Tax=Pseudomonas sp. KNUC1026 TaxID=2893890 RepID=UPI001F232993|nr:sulfurtransferase complex subunit TusB [Pseudomonas sp. KNUC1026]UFH51268.1 sulfurtransferase complex subunit TusB [Pseudomonas sp. KNUC1026]
MTTLHVLSHSPFTDNRLDSCLRLLGLEDGVLLCGDATYALRTPDALKGARLFVLAEDAEARGLEVPPPAQAIDYSGFVELALAYDKVNTWL